MDLYDSTMPGVGRMKPCPYCNGRGSVPSERDTLRMTAEEAEAFRASALPTTRPPPPLDEDAETTVGPLGIPAFRPIVEVEQRSTPVAAIVPKRKHDLVAVIFALLITAAFLGGLAYVLAV